MQPIILRSSPGWLLLFPVAASLAAQWPSSGLSLIHLESGSATLVVERSHGPVLRYRSPGGPDRSAPVSGDGILRHAFLAGLTPGALYTVESDAGSMRFRTPEADGRRWRLAVVGHTGGTHPRRRHPPEELVAQVEALRPDGVIHTGDAVYDCTPEAFRDEFLRLFDPVMSRVPLWIAPGNHECGFPSSNIDYETFKSALPYPYPASSRAKGAPPFYEVQRGPLRLIFLCYFRRALLPGGVQHAWLMERLADRSSTFTALVMGMGPSTFPERDEVLASLPPDSIDLILAGDGDGCWMSESDRPTILFNGSGGTTPHPITLIEILEHELVLNVYSRPGVIRFHRIIRDRRDYPAMLDIRPYFARGLAEGGKFEDGGARFERKDREGGIVAASGVLPPLEAKPRGLQIRIALEADRDSDNATASLHLGWRCRGTEDPGHRYRSQPFPVPLDGVSRLYHWPIPEASGAGPERAGFVIEAPPRQLRAIRIERFEVF